MTTFGEKLRHERESRNVTLREIATETKIGLRYLKALESGDFASLPGGVFNKGYVRAYAAYIGADAEGLVQAYLEEEERTRGVEARPGDRDVLQALAESAAPGPQKPMALRPAVLLVPLAIALVAVAGWAYLRFGEPGDEPTPAVVGSAEARDPLPAEVEAETPAELPTEVASPPAPPAPTAENGQEKKTVPPPVEIAKSETVAAVETGPDTAAPPAAEPSTFSVPEFGVGTAVVNRQLQGKSDRFAEGTQIWFWTRVIGGEAGDRVRHVWIRDGRQVSSVELNLGGPHWRTQSRKTLLPGSVGRWAVEARDAEDRVLAREEFVCER